MKFKLIIYLISFILIISFSFSIVNAHTSPPCSDLIARSYWDNTHGVELCSGCVMCGARDVLGNTDGICPDDFGVNCPLVATVIDTDCCGSQDSAVRDKYRNYCAGGFGGEEGSVGPTCNAGDGCLAGCSPRDPDCPTGECTPGNVETGTACGRCGVLTRQCNTEGRWGNWYCAAEAGVCTQGETRCDGVRFQTCLSSCNWQNSGNDPDNDGTDTQCGDTLCANIPQYTDATKLNNELTTCNDGIDNDCDGSIDEDKFQRICSSVTLSSNVNLEDLKRALFTGKNDDQRTKLQNQLDEATHTYESCEADSNDIACCSNPNSCVYNNVCYNNGDIADVDSDGIEERCVASSPGRWVESFETICNDGIDNDVDSFTDCQDTDCAGSLIGVVESNDGNRLRDIRIGVTTIRDRTLREVASATTGENGAYTINDQNAKLCSGNTYNVIASDRSYLPKTITNIIIEPRAQVRVDFIGANALFTGTTCLVDCTQAGDGLIHAACNGTIVGDDRCLFYDAQAMSVCNLARPEWVRDYDETHIIVCAEGIPQPKIETPVNLQCTGENIVRITRVVYYRGRPVRMVVAVCG